MITIGQAAMAMDCLGEVFDADGEAVMVSGLRFPDALTPALEVKITYRNCREVWTPAVEITPGRDLLKVCKDNGVTW